MDDESYKVALGAHRFGGSFAKALLFGALSLADNKNTAKLKTAFPKLWKQYLEMGTKLFDRGEEL